MEELIELLREEIKIEREFYARNGNLFDVEERALKALLLILIKVQGRIEISKLEI